MLSNMGPIEAELTNRLWQVASRSWRDKAPSRIGECCLIMTVTARDTAEFLSFLTSEWLHEFVDDYDGLATTWYALAGWNDTHTQQEIVWMLEEAIDQAKELGV